jgi:hypothetical protein
MQIKSGYAVNDSPETHAEQLNEKGVIRVDYNISPNLGDMQMGGSEQDVRDALARGVSGFGYAVPQSPAIHAPENTPELNMGLSE